MLYRYKDPDQKIIDRYNKEISMITEMKFTAYFLINWDIVNFARHHNHFYVGRGKRRQQYGCIPAQYYGC